MKYEVILLDADGTLFDFDKAESYALRNTYGELSIEFTEDALEKYRMINDRMWKDYEKGCLDMTCLRTKRFEILFGEKDRDYKQINDTYIKYLSEGSFEIEGSREVCEILSKKYRLVILTNGTASVQKSRLKHSSLYPFIEATIISEETGYKKPDAAIFDYTLKHIGHRDKSSVLIVGDSLSSDIKGGINAGIDTCWYNRKAVERTNEIIPTYEISKLEELLFLLY